MNEFVTTYQSTQYKKAFKEVLVILNSIPKCDYKKIPYDIIQTLKENQEYSYDFHFETEMSDIAKAILENFYRDYWVTDVEREKILQEEKHTWEEIEEEKKEKYNPNDIFKNHNHKRNNPSQIEKTALMEVKEDKWYKKIVRLLQNFFNKK